ACAGWTRWKAGPQPGKAAPHHLLLLCLQSTARSPGGCMHLRRLTVLTAVMAATLAAQDSRGSIVGHVTDKSGAALADLEVRAINRNTGVVAAGKASSAGDFIIPFLLPGFYSVAAEKTGFKKFVREGIEV